MANQLRDEMEVVIGEGKYLLRPTFEGLLEIEDKAGMGLLPIMQEISKGNISAKLIVSILYGGIIGGGQREDYAQFGQKCFDHGIIHLAQTASKFFSKVLESRQKKIPKEPQ